MPWIDHGPFLTAFWIPTTLSLQDVDSRVFVSLTPVLLAGQLSCKPAKLQIGLIVPSVQRHTSFQSHLDAIHKNLEPLRAHSSAALVPVSFLPDT